jgi:hypothetical protein
LKSSVKSSLLKYSRRFEMRTFVWLLIVASLCSCRTTAPTYTIPDIPAVPESKARYIFKPGVLDAFSEVRDMPYIGETGPEDYWQTPSETNEKGGGDCEDQAFYLQKKLLQIEGVDSWVVVGRFHPDSDSWHAWVECLSYGTRYILDPTGSKIIRHQDRDILYHSGEGVANKYDLDVGKRRLKKMTDRLEKGEGDVWSGIVLFGEKLAQ